MYYLKCKHCNHLNEVKSSTWWYVVCVTLETGDNYKDWKVGNTRRSHSKFQREVCLTEEPWSEEI